MKKQYDWSTYYSLTSKGEPSLLLQRALPYVSRRLFRRREALELGAGALRDSKFLISKGFNVVAVDKEPHVAGLAGQMPKDRFRLRIASFESFDFPKEKFDLVSAMMSLPFNEPDS